jgi:hypothetical protein
MQHCMLYGKFSAEDSLERLFQVYRKLFEQIDIIINDAKVTTPEGKLRIDTHLFFSFVNGLSSHSAGLHVAPRRR